MGTNHLLGGHADFDGGHPCLVKDLLKIILVIEVPLAPLRPEVVKKKTTENLQGLLDVGEAVNMIALEVGRVIFAFENDFAQ
jgi:hypothetical protein